VGAARLAHDDTETHRENNSQPISYVTSDPLHGAKWDTSDAREILRLSEMRVEMELDTKSRTPESTVFPAYGIEELNRTSTPSPTPEPIPYEIPELAALCNLYDDWDFNTCYQVGDCEMGGYWQPDALGKALEVGVFQIHPGYHTQRVLDMGYQWEDLYDPAINVIVAHAIWDDAGWGLWSCYWRIL
jgi:hypothetical protein